MSATCPSPTELAALATGRLPAERAAALRQHLASCEDCYEAVTEAAVFAEEEAAAGGEAFPRPLPAALPLRPRRPATVWVRRLGVAAALVAAAGVAWWWSVARRGGVEALYAAADDPRPGEVRLAGAPYQAPDPVLRGARDGPRWRVLAATERAREAAADRPSARNLHALGVAHLLLGDPGAAIEQLARARRAAPDEGRIASDLAAALVYRALAEGRREDAAAALELLRAKGEDELAPEDRFNRALALEELATPAEALAAWEEYLAADPDSPWAAEARERLADLRR